MAKGKKKQNPIINALVVGGLATLVGLAIREQLQRPPEERTWHGKLYGIPYDFRWPTIERIRDAFWNKNTARVLVPQAFGMGWTINFYPLINPPTVEQARETAAVK
ncbi:MAG TPA: DUF5808 domain-containing protein [Ktedonobacteraceae bacterium]|jgi:hypothetical protein|nr:DUF5808 domain-containing protein [Ktedonobacteraceae bacterium]